MAACHSRIPVIWELKIFMIRQLTNVVVILRLYWGNGKENGNYYIMDSSLSEAGDSYASGAKVCNIGVYVFRA